MSKGAPGYGEEDHQTKKADDMDRSDLSNEESRIGGVDKDESLTDKTLPLQTDVDKHASKIIEHAHTAMNMVGEVITKNCLEMVKSLFNTPPGCSRSGRVMYEVGVDAEFVKNHESGVASSNWVSYGGENFEARELLFGAGDLTSRHMFKRTNQKAELLVWPLIRLAIDSTHGKKGFHKRMQSHRDRANADSQNAFHRACGE